MTTLNPVFSSLSIFFLFVFIGLVFFLFTLRKKNQVLSEEQSQKNDEILELKEKYISEKTARIGLEAQIKTNKENQNIFKESIENQFKLIAQSVLEKKSDQFKNLHLEQLQSVINPFKSDVFKLEKRVNEVHDAENKQRASLEKTIENLISISSSMKDEANKLSTAIISDNKQQGNWGEIVLERLFESAGLKVGVHYDMQKHFKDSKSGKTIIPDAIIYLPDHKKVIVDSKVSIKHYYQSFSAENKIQKQALIKEHYLSILKHIKELSEKYYTKKVSNSFNYVLMFIPFESGLTTAMDYDGELYDKAIKKNILLVTPSTLLVSLTAIRALWQSENQRKNIEKIVIQGSKIYDKARLFVDDIEKIGKSLSQVDSSYKSAKSRLFAGKGNLISLSENMKKMGVSVKKSIDSDIVANAEIDEIDEKNQQITDSNSFSNS